MSVRPDVRYADSSGVSIAYTRHGVGEEIVVFMPSWVSNVELWWDLAEYERALLFAGEHHELVTIDKRGIGLSDRTTAPPTLDERVADVLAVMDAEGIESAHIAGWSEGGPVAMALAARYPTRVRSLIMHGTFLFGAPPAELAAARLDGEVAWPIAERFEAITSTWGRPDSRSLDFFAPSIAHLPRAREWAGRFERLSASPSAARAHMASSADLDVTDLVGEIRCPVFIGHALGDRVVPAWWGRHLAAQFPDATVRFWDCPDHQTNVSVEWREIQSDIIEWITGTRPPPLTTSAFATVLFTDIVDSTRSARSAGDAEWERLIQAHDAAAARPIERHGGRRVKGTGDGLLIVFDEPMSALRCAAELHAELEALGIEIRCGLHAGQVREQPDGDVIGIAVNLAARVEAEAGSGQTCVSRTIVDLTLGERIDYRSLGLRELKGIDVPMEVFVVA